MAQHDYVISNASGATVRADINSALSAIQTLNSGTSAPSSTAAGMLWLDTTGGAPYALKVRDAGNNHWLTLASVTDPGSDGNIETSATIKGAIDSSASLANATFPAGHCVQAVQSQFNPSLEQTSSTSYQFSTVFKVIQKKHESSKILVTLAGGHGYNAGYPNGLITTICQTSSATSFTPTTTYSSSDDPTNNSAFGMEQIYNGSTTNTTSHSISWLFDSSGNEFEGFRCFFKSRTSHTAVFHENNLSYITLTLMEIKQ